jgi:type I pantothenate kinase
MRAGQDRHDSLGSDRHEIIVPCGCGAQRDCPTAAPVWAIGPQAVPAGAPVTPNKALAMHGPNELAPGHDNLSPYRVFRREEWARLRADTPLTLTADDVVLLQSLNDPISLDEVVAIYLPLSRLLSLYVAATQGLFKATQRFLLAENEIKVPYIIGIAGSVAVGKSTTARVLKALLARWPNTPKVDLVTTDGFLLPNAILQSEGLMEKKGFPESYDLPALLHFLSDVKAGRNPVRAPIYSHLIYDVVPNQWLEVDRPDILIVEGLNVLQPARMPKGGEAIPFVSDFFNFSIYMDADAKMIEEWYVTRFMRLRQTAFRDPAAYFHRYAGLSPDEARAQALEIWRTINEKNLYENILPTRQRARLILRKGANHRIESVSLRRI